MLLQLQDPKDIERYAGPIRSIGDEANDHDLYDRIQEALHERRAFFFESPDGFAVLKPMAYRKLLVWVAWSRHSCDRGLYGDEIEQLARDIEADSLEFWSNRRGFHRIAPHFGYRPTESEWCGQPITIWRKRLEYDHV